MADSRTKLLRVGLSILGGKTPKLAPANVAAAVRKARGYSDDVKVYATDLGTNPAGTVLKYAGKGSVAWDRAYFSLTVNTLPKEVHDGNDDSIPAARAADVMRGVPLVIVNRHVWMFTTDAHRAEMQTWAPGKVGITSNTGRGQGTLER